MQSWCFTGLQGAEGRTKLGAMPQPEGLIVTKAATTEHPSQELPPVKHPLLQAMGITVLVFESGSRFVMAYSEAGRKECPLVQVSSPHFARCARTRPGAWALEC